MILIGENIHVISKSVRQALVVRDEKFICSLIDLQKNMDFVDLNVGPAKGELEGVLVWLAELVGKDKNISFDTTNFEEMKKGLEVSKGKSFINSTSLDEPRLTNIINLALEYNSNLIALTLGKETGIPKNADGRMEIAFKIYEKCLEKGIDNEKLFFDPLVLPVNIEQSQGIEAINTIKMIKESFDPPVRTVIGLSNISNGCPKEFRPVINRVFACMAFGAGLDAAIVDAGDLELFRLLKMLENNSPESEIDFVYTNLAEIIRDFSDLDALVYDENSVEQLKIIKAARMLLNREIYSHSFTQI